MKLTPDASRKGEVVDYAINFDEKKISRVKIVKTVKEEKVVTDLNQIAFLFHSVKNKDVIALTERLEVNGIPVFSPRSAQFFDREVTQLVIGLFMMIFPQVFKILGEKEEHMPETVAYYRSAAIRLKSKFDDDPKGTAELVKWAKRKARDHAFLDKPTDYTFLGLFYEALKFPLFADFIGTNHDGTPKNSRDAFNLALFSQLLAKFEYIYGINVLSPKWLESNLNHLFTQFLHFMFKGGLEEFEDYDERVPSGCVSVMTIHQSKGLEFHSVIIPFCDWKFESSTHPSTLWVETNPAQYEQMPCLPIVRGKAMKDSDFTDAYREETKQIWMDNLNLLYVAFTRPTANLIVLRRALAASDTPTDVSAFIDKGLAGKMPDNMTICTLHDSKAGGENKLLTQPDTQKVQFHATPIDLEFRQSNASRTFINRGDDTPMSTFIEEGNLLHDIFAHIDTKDDVTAAVQRLYTEGVIDAARKDELERFVRQALQQPVAADWFAGQYILYNECTVLTVTDDGDIIQHRPDRVMCTPDRTIVVDFKFGQRRNDHVDQVRLYMDLLAQMGFKGIEGYLWYVKEQQTIKI